MPKEKNLTVIAKEVEAFMLSQGFRTQTELARVSGVHQPTISRLLRGELRRVATEVRSLCEYANISVFADRNPSENAVLMAALRDVWDGTDDDAARIANVLRSVAAMRSKEVRRRASRN
jgi:hypothetical protein